MPRSFLVKKHLSHKKPNYGTLDSQSGDPHTQVIPVLSSCSKLTSPHPDESFLPGPCLLNQAIRSVSQMSSICAVIEPQPLQDSRLPSEGHTYTLAVSQTQLRASEPAAPQRHHSDRALPDSVVSNVAVSLLGLASKGNIQEHFECFDCHKTYFTFSGLAKHRQLQCEWPCQKYFSCKYCDKEYVSLGALKMHIRTHTLPCVCKLCGKAFSRPWLLQGHIRTHTGEKPFSCPHCSRAFADRSNLRAHLQTHSDVKKYQCRSCSKTFSRISLLSKHEEAGCCLSS
ncbi:zinc finger protein SNAI3 [Ictalurus punctatus]|uniref:Zinc finger protein SNAI2 n=1 Tax=Ictalurus punctatus TaxID=7998 RepID=A0A2D0Q6G7_ICTPU|nr:zinc finger protein SNAI3 [Ictalurus punctatus]